MSEFGEGWDRFDNTTQSTHIESDDYIMYDGDSDITSENIKMDSEALFYEGD